MSDDVSSALTRVTPPASEPLTLAQVKAFMRIEHTGDDAVIPAAIGTARASAENYIRRVLLPQIYEFRVGNPCSPKLVLPVSPATSITSITLVNEQGTTSVLPVSQYRLSVDGKTILFLSALATEIVKVQFTAGAYATVADIPPPLIQGMLHHVAALLEQRDGAAGLPMQSVQCYAPYRQVTL